MAQSIDLFIAIAEIAGVFVAFGALISVTRRTQVEVSQLGRIRAVVTIGLTVVIAALVPVLLDSYGITGHTLWLVSSFAFLILIWAVIILSLQRPENRMLMTSQAQANPVMAAFFWIVLEVPVQAPLVLILIGRWPDLEPAFYTTSLVFSLFEAAYVLAQLVYAQMSPPGD